MWSLSSFIAVLLGSWAIFHLIHNLLLSSNWLGNLFEEFLENNNISISVFHIRWFTKRWNRFFIQVGKTFNLSLWFNAGIIFAFLAMLVSIVLLTHMLTSSILDLPVFKQEKRIESSQMLKVVVPGVNLPIDDIAYLVVAILLAGILHEFGHAVAAVRERVQVNGFGIFLFFIYPGAYVDLNSDDLSKSAPLKQLRIYCAGVWHNFVMCLISCLIIFYLPWFVFPLYSSNGAIVLYQSSASPLVGDKGIEIGDTVKKIGSCLVSDVDSWMSCINKTSNLPQLGSCAILRDVHGMDGLNASWKPGDRIASDSHCCAEAFSQTHICYTYSALSTKSFACLPGRVMMSRNDCVTTDDCVRDPLKPKDKEVCVTPHIDDDSIRFTRIVVKRKSSHYHVLYYGNPLDLAAYVTVSDFTPRFSFLPIRAPAMLLKFLQYVFSMSGALALLNIVPCYALDGQWAFKAFVDYFLGEAKNVALRDRFCTIVLNFGTALVACNVVIGLLVVAFR